LNIRNIEKLAEQADMIVNGYAITKCDLGYSVVNLNIENSSAIFDENNEMIQTSMDDIELRIAHDYLVKNKKILEQ
jgi:hypothetical protein